jgi:hypothetical protein
MPLTGQAGVLQLQLLGLSLLLGCQCQPHQQRWVQQVHSGCAGLQQQRLRAEMQPEREMLQALALTAGGDYYGDHQAVTATSAAFAAGCDRLHIHAAAPHFSL